MREQGTEELWSQHPWGRENPDAHFWDISQVTRASSGRHGWQDEKLSLGFNRLFGLKRQN